MEAFRRLDVCGRALALEGCHSVELHLPLTDDEPILVTALWDDPAAYDAWLAAPSRAETTGILDDLLAREPQDAVLYCVPLAGGDVAAAIGERP